MSLTIHIFFSKADLYHLTAGLLCCNVCCYILPFLFQLNSVALSSNLIGAYQSFIHPQSNTAAIAFVTEGPSQTEAQVTWQKVSSHWFCNAQMTKNNQINLLVMVIASGGIVKSCMNRLIIKCTYLFVYVSEWVCKALLKLIIDIGL